jgi:hypothetical protein
LQQQNFYAEANISSPRHQVFKARPLAAGCSNSMPTQSQVANSNENENGAISQQANQMQQKKSTLFASRLVKPNASLGISSNTSTVGSTNLSNECSSPMHKSTLGSANTPLIAQQSMNISASGAQQSALLMTSSKIPSVAFSKKLTSKQTTEATVALPSALGLRLDQSNIKHTQASNSISTASFAITNNQQSVASAAAASSQLVNSAMSPTQVTTSNSNTTTNCSTSSSKTLRIVTFNSSKSNVSASRQTSTCMNDSVVAAPICNDDQSKRYASSSEADDTCVKQVKKECINQNENSISNTTSARAAYYNSASIGFSQTKVASQPCDEKMNACYQLQKATDECRRSINVDTHK